jgi:hypothetical protein
MTPTRRRNICGALGISTPGKISMLVGGFCNLNHFLLFTTFGHNAALCPMNEPRATPAPLSRAAFFPAPALSGPTTFSAPAHLSLFIFCFYNLSRFTNGC